MSAFALAGYGETTPLFGLAPCGVLPATRVTTGAVRSYRTFSPLPASALAGFSAAGLATCRWLCIFCATVLQVALTGGYPAHCPAEFGLSSRLRALRRSGGRSSGSLQQSILPRGGMGAIGGTGWNHVLPFRPVQPLLPIHPSLA